MSQRLSVEEAFEALESIKQRMVNLDQAFKTPMDIGMRMRGIRNALREMPVELQEVIDVLRQQGVE